MIAKDASRISWYSLLVSVRAGAIVIESPVWTPIGSKFSIEQIAMHWSLQSRITSISSSFQPSKDSSIKISPAGEALSPNSAILSNSSLLYAIPPPVPPSVKLGRIISGYFLCLSAHSRASFNECTTTLSGTSKPILSMDALNFSLSSPFSIAFASAPISSTPYFCRIPRL